jgi:hypothetical protein
MFSYLSRRGRYVFLFVLLIGIALSLRLLTLRAYSQDQSSNVFLPSVLMNGDRTSTTTPSPTTAPGTTIPPRTPTPTATAPPPDASACATHDPHAYHTLWNSALHCHYSHEHKDNPHEVDDIFGTQFYEWAGGEISYPWQTFAGAHDHYPAPPAPGVYENELKHIGYSWMVRRNLNCPSEPCITDFRVQIHSLMGPVDAVIRFHSYWAEVRVRHSGGQYGIIRRGGWMDFGHLEVNGEHVPLPGDPATEDTGSRRLHGDTPYATWYGTNRNDFIGVAVLTADAWAPVDAADPAHMGFFCPDFRCPQNYSTLEAHVVAVRTQRYGRNNNYLDGSPIDTDLRTNYVAAAGYTDRYGNVVTNCSEPGLDCIPYEIINMPVLAFLQYRGDAREYDLSPPNQYWIRYGQPQ